MSLPPVDPGQKSTVSSITSEPEKEAKGSFDQRSAAPVPAKESIPEKESTPDSGKSVTERQVTHTAVASPKPEKPVMPQTKTGIRYEFDDYGPHYYPNTDSKKIPAQLLSGNYESEEKTDKVLARGSNGYVQKVALNDDQCVLKRLYPMVVETEKKGEIVHLFLSGEALLREGRMLHWLEGQPDHQEGKVHVISVYGSGVVNKEPYLILPLADKGTLREQISVSGLPDYEILPYTEQLIKGLAFLHKHDVAHQDLKTSNLLLDSSKGLLIGDFGEVTGESGMAAFDHIGNYNPNQVAGTPYIRPGGRLSEPCGTHADIWAAGLVFMNMLVGEEEGGKFTEELNRLGRLKKDYKELTEDERNKLVLDISTLIKSYSEKTTTKAQYAREPVLSLMEKCLTFDMTARPTADDLLGLFKAQILKLSKPQTVKTELRQG